MLIERMTKAINLWLVMIFLTIGRIFGQTDQETIPKIIEKDGRHSGLY